jgi:phosphatidate cytidylyltransferase
MLKQRVITALLLAPLVISAVLLLPSDYLAWIFALVVLLGSREWAELSGLRSIASQLAYVAIHAAIMVCIYLVGTQWLLLILLITAFWWLMAVVRLMRYSGEQGESGFSLSQAFDGVIVLIPAWLALVALHRLSADGPYLLLFLLILIWGADIGAYFAGRRWGRVKLAPRVSPGKTREGVFGAMGGALVCGIFFAWWQQLAGWEFLLGLILCLVTALFSVAGDLFESMLKRRRGVKDSSNLLPGHGGVLDRIDSLTVAAPVFLLGLNVLLGRTL